MSRAAATDMRRRRRRRGLDPTFYIDSEIAMARDQGKTRAQFLERIAEFPGTPGVMALLLESAAKRWDQTVGITSDGLTVQE